MNNITVNTNEIPDIKDILALYNDAGWITYTENPDVLLKAFYSSLCIITAWHDKELAGVLRAVGDGMTIIYIQDIIVKSTYQRQGIGKMLLNELLKEFKDVRQKVLLTDNQPDTVEFYKSCDFSLSDTYGIVSFVKFN